MTNAAKVLHQEFDWRFIVGKIHWLHKEGFDVAACLMDAPNRREKTLEQLMLEEEFPEHVS